MPEQETKDETSATATEYGINIPHVITKVIYVQQFDRTLEQRVEQLTKELHSLKKEIESEQVEFENIINKNEVLKQMTEGKNCSPEMKKLIVRNKDKIIESKNIAYDPIKLYENKFTIKNVKVLKKILEEK